VKLATAGVFESMMEPIDHLEMTAAHLNDQTLSMVMKQLQTALSMNGLQEIEAVGKPFDPHQMEAIEAVEGEKDVVVTMKRKGYLLNGMVLRPAQVEVGNGQGSKGN
jgi:molecular chaperone GrpE